MLKTLNVIFLSFILLTACSSGDDSITDQNQDEKPVIPEDPEKENLIKVVAHRGAWKEFDLPDNSLAALNKAIEIGSHASECDIQLTKDHKVVVYHDEKINGQFLKNLTYDEIADFSLSNGEHVPLLSDFLEVVVEADFELWLDIKSLSDDAGGNDWSGKAGEEAAKVIRELKAERNVAYIVGRKAVLDKCLAAIKGDWEAAYMNTAYTPEQFEGQGLGWANFSYNDFYKAPQKLDAYTIQGIKLSVYTVDEEEVMDWFLLQEDLYAISSNYPKMLLDKQ